jgi:LysM repeat protein
VNSVKNAIVTMTLLAVGYGAYVVLNNPAPESLDEMAADASWAAPEVSTGTEGSQAPNGSTAPSDPATKSPPADAPGTSALAASATPPATGALDEAPPTTFDPPTLNPPAADSMAPTGGWPEGTPPADASAPYAATPDAGAADATAPDTGPADPIDGSLTHETAAVDAEPRGESYYSQGAAATTDYPDTGAPALPLQAPGADTDTESSPATPVAQDDSGFEATWQSTQADLRSGQLANALLALSAWYGETALTVEQQSRCIKLLDQLAGSVIYSRESILEPAHVVEQGETLDELSRRYSIPVEFLARINGIEAPYQLLAGESLKVVRGPFRAELDRQRGVVTVFLGRYYAGRFVARCGAGLPDSAGSYEVVSIEPGRAFFDAKSGYRVERDDPKNPFGSHWIGLRGDQITAAHNVGIHVDTGDNQHTSIAVSAVDADDLSAILSIGSRVAVR